MGGVATENQTQAKTTSANSDSGLVSAFGVSDSLESDSTLYGASKPSNLLEADIDIGESHSGFSNSTQNRFGGSDHSQGSFTAHDLEPPMASSNIKNISKTNNFLSLNSSKQDAEMDSETLYKQRRKSQDAQTKARKAQEEVNQKLNRQQDALLEKQKQAEVKQYQFAQPQAQSQPNPQTKQPQQSQHPFITQGQARHAQKTAAVAAAKDQTARTEMVQSAQKSTGEVLSQEAVGENGSLARTLVYKSSETSGLIDLYDRMYQENPFEADANLRNLIQQTRVLDKDVAQKLTRDLSATRQKYGKQIVEAKERFRTGRDILGQLRSADHYQAQQAMQRMQELHATDDDAFKALPEEARLWYESQQMKYRTNPANFYEGTSDYVKHKNLVTTQERGKGAAGTLYSADAADKEITSFTQDLNVGMTLLKGGQPDYDKFEQEIAKIKDRIPDVYRNTWSVQGGRELAELSKAGIKVIPGVGSFASAGETAKKLEKAGLSLNAQRIGAGISGIVNGLGGKLSKNGLNDILLHHFGKDLKQLSSKELDSLSNTLFDQGVSLGADGLVDMIAEDRGQDAGDDNLN